MQGNDKTLKKDINKSKCPPELQGFIDIANMLGTIFYLPTRDEMNPSFLADDSLSFKEKEQLLIETYKKSFKKNLNKQIFEAIFSAEDLSEIETRIAYLRSIQVGITSLAYAEEVTYEGGSDLVDLWNRMNFDYPDQSADLTVRIYLDREGYLRVHTNPFLKYISENNIKAERIRLCQICKKIFWAKRLESRACSKNCAVIFRQRKWREKNKEEYNEQRRLNYAYKKSIKKGDNSNGTL